MRAREFDALCLEYLLTDLIRYELFYGIVKWLTIKPSLGELPWVWL